MFAVHCFISLIAYSDTPADTPYVPGTTTPRIDVDVRHFNGVEKPSENRQKLGTVPQKTKKVIEYDSDIEPEDLMPVYLETKAKLFHLQSEKSSRPLTQRQRVRGNASRSQNGLDESDPEVAKLRRKMKQIEGDILFDQYIADKQWENQRVLLEREAAVKRSVASNLPMERERHPAECEDGESEEDEVSRQAAEMAAELLEEDSDDNGAISDLFASLPVAEVDAVTGKSSTIINGADGSKITIRDFGKTTGVSARRVLEEACRSR